MGRVWESHKGEGSTWGWKQGAFIPSLGPKGPGKECWQNQELCGEGRLTGAVSDLWSRDTASPMGPCISTVLLVSHGQIQWESRRQRNLWNLLYKWASWHGEENGVNLERQTEASNVATNWLWELSTQQSLKILVKWGFELHDFQKFFWLLNSFPKILVTSSKKICAVNWFIHGSEGQLAK